MIPHARRAVRSFTVETYYSGPRVAHMALQPIPCGRCGRRIPPGAHFTHGGRCPAHPLCYDCVPFFLPQEAPKWLRPPVKPIRTLRPNPTPAKQSA